MQSNFATLRIRIFLENTAMTALVIAEHDNHQLLPATCHAITAAAQCANEVHVLVAGHNAAVVAQATAQLAGVDPAMITKLALGFVVARILHGAFYVGDAPRLRSLSWLVGMLCVLTLIVLAALKVA